MLYAAPILLILAGRMRGCRPEERRLIAGIGIVCAVGCAIALGASLITDERLVKGVAYSFLVLAATHLAMLLGPRDDRGDDSGGPDDGDEGDPEPPDRERPPFDWDDFERRFWDEVERRRERTPV
jgi:hypothetical protein